MNTLFKHFILTRFNIVDEAVYNVSYDYVNRDEYLSERFQLFEFFCLPSINNQTNSNFTWLVLFNDRLPEKWKEKIENYKQKCPNFEPRYISFVQTKGWENFLNEFIIKELNDLEYPPKFLITTRLDNDDAFHLSFVDSLQNYFLEHQEEAIINYANGLQYIPRYNVLKNHTVVRGHFGTLVEKNSPSVRTVLSFSHDPLPAFPKSTGLNEKKRMWLEVIHKTNVYNVASFQFRHLLNDLFFAGSKYKNLNNFGIKQPVSRLNFYVWKLFFTWFAKRIRAKIINKFRRKSKP